VSLVPRAGQGPEKKFRFLSRNVSAAQLLPMASIMTRDSSETNHLLRRAASGDNASWGAVLQHHEGRLRRMVAFRLDQRLQGRIDPSDVVQEVCLAASRSLPDYLRQPAVPFFLWLRGIAGNKLLELHRHHLGTPMRDARREVSLYRGSMPETTSAALAAQLMGRFSRPSEVAVRVEVKVRLQEALNQMDPVDREVLALRHFEHLSNAEAAEVLGIKEGAAGKRYLRALERLREILANTPGGMEWGA
jgi:RNA polymerase sigma-70 factor (ECF subfamily)